MAKRSKPSSPQAANELRLARIEAERIESVGGIATVAHEKQEDGSMKWVARGSRPDCFTALLRPARRPGERCWMLEYGAVLWLEDLVRTAQGESGGDRRPDFIRSSCEGAPGQNISQAQIDAGKILAVVEGSMPPAQMRLLFDLLRPDAALEGNWRPIAARCSGEVNPQAQGAAVRAACTSLLWVQDNIDRLKREYQDRRIAA